jgi:hypothetical protein
MVMVFAGCGAATTNSGDSSKNITSDKKSDSQKNSPSSLERTKQNSGAAVSDSQAEQAALFCSHEIKKSDLQPPDMLNKKQINSCLIAIRPQIQQECSKGVAKEIIVKIILDKSGTVKGAFSVGDSADSAEANCIVSKVKEVVFPKFKAVNQQIIEKYPFKIKN